MIRAKGDKLLYLLFVSRTTSMLSKNSATLVNYLFLPSLVRLALGREGGD
jgi:hypothetical protein